MAVAVSIRKLVTIFGKARLRLLVAGAATGLIVGVGLAVVALDLSDARELAGNRQWFALATLVSSPLGTWTVRGLLMGLAVASVLALLGRPQFVPRRFQRIVWQLLAFALIAIPLLAIALKNAPLLRPKPDVPSIVLIVLDTTRPDRLSLYGYDRPTTPELEKLAAEATVYTEAYATSSWTPPSHASLFTGLYPCAHGVTQEASGLIPSLPTRFLTLAEALWESGFRTTGINGNGILGARTGFSQGFEEYHETWNLDDQLGRHPAEILLEATLDSDSDRPFFAFINMIEPHRPYNSSREYFGLYDRHPQIDLVDVDWAKHLVDKDLYDADDLQHLSDLYDSEIQYVDSVVGRMVDLLRARNVLDETLLVVTADHGEHFGEHGLLAHRFNLYETNVRVPLLIRYPKVFRSGARDTAHVQLHDLFETILSVAGSRGRYASQGSSLDVDQKGRPALLEYYFPLLELRIVRDQLFRPGGRPEIADLGEAVPEVEPFMRRLRAIRNGRLKLIWGSDGNVELYDIPADPEELTDLSGNADYAEELEQLKAQLSEQISGCIGQSRTEQTIQLDEEQIRQLKSLGYIR
jgi:arylsulfatase A-like enzyme